MYLKAISNTQKLFASRKIIFDRLKLILSSPSLSTSVAVQSSEENKLTDLLRAKFPKASTIQVQDVSGGCGAMYEVWVESNEFKGLSRVKQHKLITQALKEEIKEMHGFTISTTIPEDI